MLRSIRPKRARRPFDASVDPTEASYLPTDASVVENARRPVAVHRKSDLNRRRSESSEPLMSLIRPAQWAGDGARRRSESAGSESVMSRGTLSTTALLRATMEPPDSVVAGRLPPAGDTEGSSWRRAVGGRSSSTWDESAPTAGPQEPGVVVMKRRSFVSLMGTGAVLLRGEATHAGGVAPEPEGQKPSGQPVKMHVGTQQGPTTPRMLQYFKRHGVNHICGYPPDPGA